MSNGPRVLAVIPARGGSKGLPGKNIRQFAGLPLIAHSIRLAQLCPEINRLVVSTDSPEIADVARRYGGGVPFMRPGELAGDDTPMWPVLQHALNATEAADGVQYDMLLLLDPTSPARLPEDVTVALQKLVDEPRASGIIGVSRPTFNPLWHCVIERDGWMTDLIDNAAAYRMRQEVPSVYRINGSIYIWRTDFMRMNGNDWRERGRHLMYEIPEIRAMSIDDLSEFQHAELLVKGALVTLPWLDDPTEGA